jgi:hypothetical protein
MSAVMALVDDIEKSEVHRRLSPRLWRVHAVLIQWGEWEHRYPGGFASTWVTERPPSEGPPGSAVPTGVLEPEMVSAARRAVHALEMPERRVMEAEYCFVHEPRRMRIVRAVQDPSVDERDRDRIYREYLNRGRWQLKALLRV